MTLKEMFEALPPVDEEGGDIGLFIMSKGPQDHMGRMMTVPGYKKTVIDNDAFNGRYGQVRTMIRFLPEKGDHIPLKELTQENMIKYRIEFI